VRLLSGSVASQSVPKCVESLRAVHARTAEQRRQLFALLSLEFDERSLAAKSPGSEEKSYIFVGPDKCEAPFGIFSGESEEESEAAYETADIFDLVAAEEEEYVFVGEPWERPSDGGVCFFNCRDLGELVEARRAVLCRSTTPAPAAALTDAPCLDEPPRSILDVVGDAWDVGAEHEAELQLLSWAAVATLAPIQRAEALVASDTAERLAFALESLREQQEDLAELLVLEGLERR